MGIAVVCKCGSLAMGWMDVMRSNIPIIEQFLCSHSAQLQCGVAAIKLCAELRVEKNRNFSCGYSEQDFKYRTVFAH